MRDTRGMRGRRGMRDNTRETPGILKVGPEITTRGPAAGMSCGIHVGSLRPGGPRLELLRRPTYLLAFKSRERWRM